MRHLLLAPLWSWVNRLRQPSLLLLTGGLFLVTLVIPDPIPLLDEIVLGLVTLGLANWTRGRKEPQVPASTPPQTGRVIEGQSRRV